MTINGNLNLSIEADDTIKIGFDKDTRNAEIIIRAYADGVRIETFTRGAGTANDYETEAEVPEIGGSAIVPIAKKVS